MGRRILRYVRRKYVEDGFFSVFGLVEPLANEVNEILGKDVSAALLSDKEKISQDFKAAFQSESRLLDEATAK